MMPLVEPHLGPPHSESVPLSSGQAIVPHLAQRHSCNLSNNLQHSRQQQSDRPASSMGSIVTWASPMQEALGTCAGNKAKLKQPQTSKKSSSKGHKSAAQNRKADAQKDPVLEWVFGRAVQEQPGKCPNQPVSLQLASLA